MECGEGGIRTLGTPVGAHTLSKRARSTAPAPLQGESKYTSIMRYSQFTSQKEKVRFFEF